MSFDRIYAKTAKGADEIARRSHGLAPRQRTLLILVDGRTSLGALAAKAAALGHPPGVFDQLESQGFIETTGPGSVSSSMIDALPTKPVSVPPPAPSPLPVAGNDAGPATARQASPAISPGARKSLAIARMYLAENIGRMFGRQSDPLLAAIRTAVTREEIVQQLDICVATLRDVSGPERAEALRQRVLDLLP